MIYSLAFFPLSSPAALTTVAVVLLLSPTILNQSIADR